MNSLLDAVASAAVDRCGLETKTPIIVGVSGGPDSLCLMDVLRRLGYEVVVAHFNHMLRPEAESEARAVEEIAGRLSLAFAESRADVRAEAKKRRLSIEDAARQLRYAFLFEQARTRRAQAVAVGHTADDQVETLLMHLIRGSGLDGLTGMSYRTVLSEFESKVPVVRPLLGVWKEAVVAYCEAHDLPALHDPSNMSADFFRNRVRNELIPALESYNPQVRHALLRTAESLSDDQGVIAERIAADWRTTVIEQTPDYVAFDGKRLAQLEPPVRRYLLRLAVRRLSPGQETGYEMLNRAASFAASSLRKREELAGGISLVREGGLLYVCRGDEVLPANPWPQLPPIQDPIPVGVPSRIELSAGWEFAAEHCERPVEAPNWDNAASAYEVWLDAATLPTHLELRAPRPGDRIRPLGLEGHAQKISDIFVNEKLPARARRWWPLLSDGDLIVWIPGFRPADAFRLRAGTRRAVHFCLTNATE